MRILHVCKYFYPRITGVTAYVDNLGRQQQAAGHAVAVATWEQEDGLAPEHGLSVLRARSGDGPGLVRLMREYRPDVIHAHSIWETTTHAVAAARALGRPYVVTTHGTWHFLEHTGAYARWPDRLRLGLWQRRVVWPMLLRRAGGVIALNALEAADGQRAGVSPNRLWRIPNAVDPAEFRPADAVAARQALGWPEGFTVLFVGAMQASKGVFTVLEAAATLEASRRPRFMFGGEGPDMERIREASSAAGLGDDVAFLGRIPRERMPGLYQAADVVVLPSRQEAFATALLEGMASGRPCVGSAVGGIPEIIEDGHTGFLVPPGDSRALAGKIDALAGDPAAASAMGRAGRQRAEEHFSWPGVARRIETVYRQALVLACLLFLLFSCPPATAAVVTPLDILAMEPPGPGRTSGTVWDGRTVRLDLARGETSAFQVLLAPEGGEKPDRTVIEARLPEPLEVRLYRVWDIWGVPEAAVPMEQGQPRPFADLGQSVAGKGDQPWRGLVEVRASRAATAGVRQGEVLVRWSDGEVRLPLEVTVQPFSLPANPSFLVEMNSYGDCLRLLPSDPQTHLELHQLFRQFRTTFTLVPYRQDGALVMDFLSPVLDGDRLDFTAFDTALGGLFDGSAFPDGQPLSRFILPLREGWPAASTPKASEARERHVAVRRLLVEHIREKGWQATRFQEFHNENPEHGARVPWRLDEPVSRSDLDGHTRFLAYRQAACRDWPGPCPLAYRIDISRWQPLASGLERLGGTVTDWSVSADPAFLDARVVDFFRGLGGQTVLAYGELPGFLVRGRATPWTAFPGRLAALWLAGVDGFAQWQADRWQHRDIPGVAPEAVPLVYSNAAGARDFIWPGHALGVAGPMPSMRLFALREGQNILDYLVMAAAQHPEAAAALRTRLADLSEGRQDDWRGFKADLARLATDGGAR